MLDSGIFQVIIGLIFVFSLLSILATQINTVLTYLMNARAKHLKEGIEDLLTDPVVLAKFLAHPLVRLVKAQVLPEQTMSAQTAQAVTASEETRVNWIEPEIFSQTLMDILATYANNQLYAPLFNAAERTLKDTELVQVRESIRRLQSSGIGVTELRNMINQIADPLARQEMLSALEKVGALRQEMQGSNESSKLIPLLEGLRHVADPNLRKALEILLASARTIEEAQSKIEFWFDTRMEHLSDFYKRKMTYLSLIIGLALTLVLNVDSLFLARTLWQDPSTRTALTVAAQTAVLSGQLQQQIEQAQTEAQNANPEATPEPGAAPVTETEGIPGLDTSATAVRESLDQFLSLNLPIGWEFTPIDGGCFDPDSPALQCGSKRNLWLFIPGNNPDWFGFIILKLIGWVITTIAVAQGAPFWFDLLNRLVRGKS
jgi:hypothetical protein